MGVYYEENNCKLRNDSVENLEEKENIKLQKQIRIKNLPTMNKAV